MFERFTERARQTVVQAQQESRALNHGYIGPEHLLLALVHDSRGMAARALADMGITEDRVRDQLGLAVQPDRTSPSGHIPFTPKAKKSLELSLREALQLGDSYIGTEHILLGLIRQDEGPAAHALQELGADLDRTRDQVIRLHPEPSVPDDQPDVPGEQPAGQQRRTAVARPVTGEPESLRAEVESLQEEIIRLRALLRRHDIDPDEDTGPVSAG
jgi:ATP-dependent Clp protease ATP-binding subunit ClpA